MHHFSPQLKQLMNKKTSKGWEEVRSSLYFAQKMNLGVEGEGEEEKL